MEEIVLPSGMAGTFARRALRRHIRELKEVESQGTDLECEIAVIEQLLQSGSVGLSFAGDARDMRRAFFAVKRMLA